MSEPVHFPEKGFYYHYKHDPAGEINAYAYEVVGVGKHTEDDGLAVVYRPLYKNDWLGQAGFCLRPLGMFTETVRKGGKSFQRFSKVADAETNARLARIKNEMYPS